MPTDEALEFTCRAPEGCEFANKAHLSVLTGEFCENIRARHITEIGISKLNEMFEDYVTMCPLRADARMEIG